MVPLFPLFAPRLARFGFGLILTLLAAGIGWRFAASLARRGETYETWQAKNPFGLASVGRILLVSACFYGLYLGHAHEHLLRWVEGYVQQSGMVIIKALLAFLLAFLWVLHPDRARLKRSLYAIIPAFLIISGVELFLLWPMVAALGGKDISRSGVILQTTGFSCAPTALANVCRAWGKRVGEREGTLAVSAGMGGSFDDEIARGGIALGFSEAVPIRTTLSEIASDDLPLVISIKYLDTWDLHAVALLGLSSSTVTLADPMVGFRCISIASFPELWRGKGIRLGRPEFALATLTPRLSQFTQDEFRRRSFSLEPDLPEGRALALQGLSPRLILLGPPGAGKSTAGKRLKGLLQIPHISLGDLFREETERGTELGKQLKETMSRGELVADPLVFAVLFSRLRQPDCQTGFLLDGFPRTIEQARTLEDHLQTANQKLYRVISLQVDRETVVQRLRERARSDDTPEAIEKRHSVYLTEIQPIEEFYRTRGILRTVDGASTPEKVVLEILASLTP